MGALPDTAIYSEQEKYCHNTENDSGTHTHFVNERKKGKKTIYENKLKYEIPEAIFKDKDNWKTGDFYYKNRSKNNLWNYSYNNSRQKYFLEIIKRIKE